MEFRLVEDQLENGKYNTIPFDLTRIEKYFSSAGTMGFPVRKINFN